MPQKFVGEVGPPFFRLNSSPEHVVAHFLLNEVVEIFQKKSPVESSENACKGPPKVHDRRLSVPQARIAEGDQSNSVGKTLRSDRFIGALSLKGTNKCSIS